VKKEDYGITAASFISGWDWSNCSSSAGATYKWSKKI